MAKTLRSFGRSECSRVKEVIMILSNVVSKLVAEAIISSLHQKSFNS